MNYSEIKNSLTNINQVDDSNSLIVKIKPLKKELDKKGVDIRSDYFFYMTNLITSYSLNIKNYYLRAFIDYEKSKSEEELLELSENFDENLFNEEFKPYLVNYKNLKINLDRNLIIECWSLFEFCVTVIFESILSTEDIEKSKDKYRKKFSKVIKGQLKDIDTEVLNLILDGLKQQVDNFIPTMNKVNKIIKHTKSSYPEKDEDIKFMTFINRLRNAIHFNFIYKGVDKPPFKFKNNTYRFEDGKTVMATTNDHFQVLGLLEEFINVAFRFLNCIETEKELKNPTETTNDK